MGAPGPEAFSDDLLERVTLHQATRGFHRLVVLFVERWAVDRQPTFAARLALAEAYVHLRLLDRAFTRVEALLGHPEATPVVWRLGVRILRMRGWLDEATSFARRAERAFPDDASMAELVDSASEPFTSAPPAQGDAAASAIAEAEAAMLLGQFVRAQVALQRVRRQLTRPHGRVDELLWAIRGDFTMDAGIEQLVPLLLPSPDSSDTLVPIDDEALGGPASAEAFRQLFRKLDVGLDEMDPDSEEATHISEMAEIVRRAGGSLESDTEIARVVRDEPDPDALETAVAGKLIEASSDYARPDHLEDDSIVVVTRREVPREPPITEPFAAEVARVSQDVRREAIAKEELPGGAVERFLHATPIPAPRRWTELLGERLREEGRSAAFWAGGAAVLLFFGVLFLGLAAWIAFV